MRTLGLDVGERRVGIAISDSTGTVARPLQALVRGSREEDFAAIVALVAEHDVGLVVVGQPLSLDGTEGPQARRVARYARILSAHLSVPVVSWDERFTTVAAYEILRRGHGQSRKRKKMRQARAAGEVDAVAAAVILQSYLDNQSSG